MVDNDVKTPRQTGAWAIAAEKTEALIVQLQEAIRIKSSANPIKRDPQGAADCEALVERLTPLVDDFKQLPNIADPDAREVRRLELTEQFRALQALAHPILKPLGLV